jgi:hypothetical protein
MRTELDILVRFCRENIAVYRESPACLLDDVNQASQVAHDYRGRLVYELLQNADDALVGVEPTENQALFRLSDSELWVANTGRQFTEADVRGLGGILGPVRGRRLRVRGGRASGTRDSVSSRSWR